MKTARNSKINRLITLCFASVLLVLIYGPLAQWFVAADRLVYDQLAGNLPTRSLNNAFIVSIDPKKATPADTFGLYGKVLETLREADAGRIILASPPDIPTDRKLPKWSALMASGAPIFVPSRHRFAEVSANNGFVDMRADADGVLRRSELWHLNGGVMSPSLPLAVALASTATAAATAPGMTNSNGAIYFSNYAELPRLSVEEVFARGSDLAGATVFVDAEPTLATAAGVLPSGQFVTASELTAALLADIENDRMIVEPGWAKALSWVAPALLAIIAVLLLPDRNRREIAVLTLSALVALLLLEALVLLGLHVRIELGRPMLLLVGIALLNAYLVPDVKKVSHDAFKKGADFLNAGRLEPAFAEFRRCNPSETVAALMYKLSLAFEEQAKPERAEAVLEWMKRTHVGPEDRNPSAKNVDGMPQKLGRYVIQRRIGRGAMGTVYLGKDPRINRAVAVKAIPIEKEFEDEELKEARLRFYREAESAGRLTHPNIITVFDAGEDKGLAYIAMEYLPGIALTDFTDPARLLAPKRAMELCATTAEALDYAHNQGVIHRDIKPANLLYNPKDGSLKISDFGVAHMTDNNRTKTGIVLGTPMYMSPEQLGAEDLTGLSDLFSLGVTLYELLVGEVPFRAPNIAVLMTKITSEDPAPVASRRSGIPPSVDAVLAKALAKRPEDRFSCGAEMAIALRNCARFS